METYSCLVVEAAYLGSLLCARAGYLSERVYGDSNGFLSVRVSFIGLQD